MRRAKWEWATLVLGIWVIFGVGFAAVTFVYKVIQFINTVPRGDVAGFAVIQVITYLLVAIGFFFLFLWSFVKGDFREMEKGKYRIFEMERRAEEKERLGWKRK